MTMTTSAKSLHRNLCRDTGMRSAIYRNGFTDVMQRKRQSVLD